jgi:predicted MPP superfamily phosphohydrolase
LYCSPFWLPLPQPVRLTRIFLGRRWTLADEFRAADYAQLTKKDGEAFRILQFTDTHINTYYDAFGTIEKTFRMMSDAVRANDPDLLILTGDNIGNFITDTAIII